MSHVPGMSTFRKRECSRSHIIKWYSSSRTERNGTGTWLLRARPSDMWGGNIENSRRTMPSQHGPPFIFVFFPFSFFHSFCCGAVPWEKLPHAACFASSLICLWPGVFYPTSFKPNAYCMLTNCIFAIVAHRNVSCTFEIVAAIQLSYYLNSLI